MIELFAGALLVALVVMVWESEQMIQEKKRRANEAEIQREFLTHWEKKDDVKWEEIAMLLDIKDEDIPRLSGELAKSNLRGKIGGYISKVDYSEDKIGGNKQ